MIVLLQINTARGKGFSPRSKYGSGILDQKLQDPACPLYNPEEHKSYFTPLILTILWPSPLNAARSCPAFSCIIPMDLCRHWEEQRLWRESNRHTRTSLRQQRSLVWQALRDLGTWSTAYCANFWIWHSSCNFLVKVCRQVSVQDDFRFQKGKGCWS